MMSANVNKQVRREAYKRDDYMCALCGDNRTLQIHHCVPRSRGGNNEIHNLITLCSRCHALAHGTKLDETWVTQEDVEQAIIEYLADMYPGEWEPFEKDIYETDNDQA